MLYNKVLCNLFLLFTKKKIVPFKVNNNEESCKEVDKRMTYFYDYNVK